MIGVELSGSRFRRSLRVFGRPARGMAYGPQASLYTKSLTFPSLYPSSVYQLEVVEEFLSEIVGSSGLSWFAVSVLERVGCMLNSELYDPNSALRRELLRLSGLDCTSLFRVGEVSRPSKFPGFSFGLVDLLGGVNNSSRPGA